MITNSNYNPPIVLFSTNSENFAISQLILAHLMQSSTYYEGWITLQPVFDFIILNQAKELEEYLSSFHPNYTLSLNEAAEYLNKSSYIIQKHNLVGTPLLITPNTDTQNFKLDEVFM